jgi:queuine tRNA-ribosyltransferase
MQAAAAGQTLFGIVQGGVHRDLRQRSAEELGALEFPGYAIGGVQVGESAEEVLEVASFSADLLPAGRPRYLMGMGTPEDLLSLMEMGIDMFDCVLPTRNGRNGMLFTSNGRISIKQARYARDPEPPDPDCPCYTCRTFSLAYLRHLFQAGEILAARLHTLHNLHFYLDLMRRARQAIRSDGYAAFRRETLARMSAEDTSP